MSTFKKIRRSIYRFWVIFCFILTFFILFPFFVLFVQRESWKKYGHFVNKIWAHIVFWSCGLPTEIIYRAKLDPNGQYVYCANHTSYLDIPSLSYALHGYNIYIGKASLAKAPLFGYMFKNLYIAVDRGKAKSRAEAITRSAEALDKGYGLAIFPEGKIPPHHLHPHMTPFKDGAFRVAIEKQVPIVPVAIINNWKILPDDGKFAPRIHTMITIVGEPIPTKGLTQDDISQLKVLTYDIIHKEIGHYYPHIL
jgi:1-acyl-sn-glycerol-3-phosphate acyltransferase